MLIKAAMNGMRTRSEHPLIPITPDQQAREAAPAIKAGAGAIHVHVCGPNGAGSLKPDDVARGYDTRIGFEDVLTLPDGMCADGNASLVAAACKMARQPKDSLLRISDDIFLTGP